IRRLCLDQTMFWTTADLEMKLRAFKDYYNTYQIHSTLRGQTPVETAKQKALILRYTAGRNIVVAKSDADCCKSRNSLGTGPDCPVLALRLHSDHCHSGVRQGMHTIIKRNT